MAKTDTYKVHWKIGAQMGYAVAFVGGSPLFEAPQGRRLYHSANYAGWKDWGGLVDFEILDQTRSMAKIKFVSDDGASKEYICVATFWDGTPPIKHEVTVKAKWDSKGDNGPFAHNTFWTKDGFSALYTTDPLVMARGMGRLAG